MTNLLIVGAPGAGKGTQAQKIAQEYNIPAISTGDIFRANISGNTDLGRKAQEYINAGNLVPDSVTNDMVRDRLSQEDVSNGFLLDGYPRTHAQAKELDNILADRNGKLDAVIYLDTDSEELVSRLLDRAQKEGRVDDTEEIIRHRLEVYDEETKPLIDIYDQQGILLAVEGNGAVDEVFSSVKDKLHFQKKTQS